MADSFHAQIYETGKWPIISGQDMRPNFIELCYAKIISDINRNRFNLPRIREIIIYQSIMRIKHGQEVAPVDKFIWNSREFSDLHGVLRARINGEEDNFETMRQTIYEGNGAEIHIALSPKYGAIEYQILYESYINAVKLPFRDCVKDIYNIALISMGAATALPHLNPLEPPYNRAFINELQYNLYLACKSNKLQHESFSPGGYIICDYVILTFCEHNIVAYQELYNKTSFSKVIIYNFAGFRVTYNKY